MSATVIKELNFTLCDFAIVRPRGIVDGQQVKIRERVVCLCLSKKVPADRGREKICALSKIDVRRWEGTEQKNREDYIWTENNDIFCNTYT